MAVKNKHTQDEHSNELLENPEALADQLSKTEQYVEKNKTGVLIIGGLLVLVVAGFFGYNTYKQNQEERAQSEMFQAIYYFEGDSLNLALNGDGNTLGFLDIADEYSITDAGNLANFYAGAAYLQLGNYEEALDYLENYSSDDLLIQSRAYALMGDAYMELQDFESAADHYQKAADNKPNKYFTPAYLMKAALAYEKTDNLEAARASYTEIIEKYWDSSEYQNARKYRARLDS